MGNLDKSKAEARAEVHKLFDSGNKIKREDVFKIINKIKVTK